MRWRLPSSAAPIAHGFIKSIDTSLAEKMPGVVGILRAKDIKGTNRLRQVHPDQPVLCEDKVRILGDPIVAVAAETREQARAAAAAVKVEYDPLPVQMTPAESLAPGAYAIHPFAPDNICCSQPIIKGDAQAAFKEAKTVYEGEFGTQTNHQAPLEPEVSSAYFEGEGENRELVIVGRSINIHFHLDQLKESIGLREDALQGGLLGRPVRHQGVDHHRGDRRRGGHALQPPRALLPHHGRIDAHHHQAACLSQHEDQAGRRCRRGT